jgi:pimeloyl-ACP methyl ester carboxylesterase
MDELLEFDDVELTYERHGQGEHVVLVHASPFVEWYDPLVAHLAGYSVVRYRRRLRPEAPGRVRPLTVEEDARICARLMAHVGWPTAHVVGHSYGALVALALAASAPERVHSMALLEPAIRDIPSSEQVVAALQLVIAAYRSGDKPAAVDGFLRAVCGDDYRATLDKVLPRAFETALTEADLFFQAEMPAVQQFRFRPVDTRRATPPVLNVVGANSVTRFVEGSELIQSWFPHAERLSVPEAGHMLMVQNPTAVTEGLMGFFTRHPISEHGQAQALSP